MSRRFGRNQKRRFREEIAKLQRFHTYATDRYRLAERHLAESQLALQEALGGGWTMAQQASQAFLLPEAAVMSFYDETSGDRRERVERKARVVVYPSAVEGLMQQIIECDRRQIPVTFRGLAWRLMDVAMSGRGTGRGYIGQAEMEEVELTLAAYASNNPRDHLKGPA